MSKISLDLKKFKHVKSDDDTATLRHEDGHELTIAKKSLSPHFQEQLEALSNMADGGKVEKPEEEKSLYEKAAEAGWLGTKAQVSEKYGDPAWKKEKKAEGGEVEYAKGGKVRNYIEGANPKHLKGEDIAAYKRHKSGHWESEHGKKMLEESRKVHDNIRKAKMADGGEVDYAKGGKVKEDDTSTQGKDVRYANKHKRRGEHDEHKQAMDYAKNEAKGRAQFEREAVKPKMKGLAEGGHVDHPSHEKMEANYAYEAGLPCKNPKCKSRGSPHPNCRCYSSRGRFAEGGEVDVKHVCEIDESHYPDCEHYAGGGEVKHKSQDPSRGQMKPVYESDQPENEDINFGVEGKLQQPEEPTQEEMESAIGEEDQAAEMATPRVQMAAEPQVPESVKEFAPQYEQTVTGEAPNESIQQNPDVSNDPVTRFAEHKQQNLNDLAKEDIAWDNDLRNGHITPQTYSGLFAKKDTLGKIGTLFGLLLSGAGSGLSGQPNAVLEMMNNEIKNDLEAQKQSKDNAENYLRLSQAHVLQQAQATQLNADTAIKAQAFALTKANRAALHSLVEQVNKMPPGSPQRINAETQLAMLNKAVQNENYNILDRAATASSYYNMLLGNQGAAGGSEEAFQRQQKAKMLLGDEGKELAGYDTDRHIPGVKGQASRPIPEHDREMIKNQNILDNKVKDVLDYATKHVGSVNPNVLATAKQKAEELTAFYNKSVDSLGMTEGRLGWLEEQIKKNPTSIIQQIMGNNARLREIRDSNVKRKDIILRNLGFKVQEDGEKQKVIPGKTHKIQTINGKQYYVPIK